MFLVIYMVATDMVEVLSVDPTKTDTTQNLPKLVSGGVSKLNSENYHLWLAGIMTVLMCGAAQKYIGLIQVE